MLHSTCPSERLNGTTGIAPRTLEDLMKRCTLLKPKLDSHYFREIGDNPFHSLFRGTNQDIILTKYAPHESNSPSSLYQPPPSAHTGLSSQLFSQDGTELWDGVVPGTQNENPLLSMRPPSEDTPTAEESQTYTNMNEYSSEYEYSGSESDSHSLMTSFAETESQSINTNEVSPHNSANSNLITGGNITNLHTEYNANRTSPNFKPKRIKLIKNSNKSTKLVSKLRIPKPWTVQEEKLLAIGVWRYGNDWKRIHTALNFSPSRSLNAVIKKVYRLKRNKKWTMYLSEFRNAAGYKGLEAWENEDAPKYTYLLRPMNKRNKGKRERKLIIDSSKAMTNDTIRAQISCYADTIYQQRAPPPISRRAIQFKARSADETLLTSPAIAINQDWLSGPIIDIFNSNFGRIFAPTPTPVPSIGIPTL